MNNRNRKNIANEENLKNATGGIVWTDSSYESDIKICPYCGIQFNKNEGNEIGGKLYCPTCWENKSTLGIVGIYQTENGVGGGW